MRKLLVMAVGAAAALAQAEVPFKLGVAGYTFHAVTLERALETMKAIDCRYLCHKDNFLPYDASDAEIAAYKARLAEYGVESLATGPLYVSEAAPLRRQFEFARRYGMKVVVGVPFDLNPKGDAVPGRERRLESDRVLDEVDRLVKEFDICYAVHNHGPDNAFLFPTAESALERIGGRDRRIGVCLDIGHEARAGLDPVDFIRRHGERIYDVHLKNIKIDPVKNIAMEGPRGELDIPAILQALADVGYTGTCHVEYEKDFKDNAMGLAESVGYYRGVMDCIVPGVSLEPAPEGANTLSAEERSEGWRLLWDGRTSDGWVGASEGCRRFPPKGWKMEDGVLTVLPVRCVKKDGSWGELPPEDAKLGGGGDIVTVEKFRDFAFKFDFRLTRAANSGVKYFYDENANRGTCEEYQLLDSGHPDHAKGRGGNRQIAALYDLMPAPRAVEVLRPLGRWNSGMIVSKGAKVEHWLNGVKVLEYERGGEEFRAAVSASKYATWGTDGRRWGELPEGRILLQDHSDSTVSFCNLKVLPL